MKTKRISCLSKISASGLPPIMSLCDASSTEFEKYVINGLEDLQAVYAKELSAERFQTDAAGMCKLLVEVKSQRFSCKKPRLR